jgi:NTP pyrophosphatase (non-canonical NTP hydrolase)
MTDIEEIENRLVKFRDERNWKQFHNLKDLALAVSVEAAELSELFLWKKPDEADRTRVSEELADIFAFAFLFAHEAKLDVKKIILEKVDSNEKKYPIAKAWNSARKYTEL